MRGRILGIFLAVLGMSITVGPVADASDWDTDEVAFVTDVIDGDTLSTNSLGRLRLVDIDAPERGEAGAREATASLKSLVYRQRILLDVDDLHGKDSYGRLVAVAYVRHNATHLLNVNRALLDADVVELRDFPNEFDPHAWTLHVYHPEGASLAEGVPWEAWILGGAFFVFEVYYVTTLHRAWRNTRRSERGSGTVQDR